MRYPCVWRLLAALAELQAGDFQSLHLIYHQEKYKSIETLSQIQFNQSLWFLTPFEIIISKFLD